jgi:peptidoglycan/xylan/chitin deacetylase (PgdA/CDA1 family)
MMQFAPVYPYLYRVLRPLFSDCLWSGSGNRPTVALTFDDGPHPHYTLELLAVLSDHGVKASFFWLGVCVERSPQVAQAVVQQGHWIGLHGYDHRLFLRLSDAELLSTLAHTRDLVAQTCGLAPATIQDVRPPYGVALPRTIRLLRQAGYRPVMWSVVPEDWTHPGVELSVQRVLNQVTLGSLIVFHDGNQGGRDVAASLDRLIPELVDRGYEFATVAQLWQQR